MKLKAEKVALVRGGRTIVSELSFFAAAGELVLFTGPNGSGKTTLLRAISGFLQLDAGQISLDGGDNERSLAEHCHYVGHANAVKPSLTVVENLQFWAGFLSGEGRAQMASALAAFDLDHLAHVPVGYLSAGQCRRTGLARLLAADRPIWLLDEPTVSLDETSVTLLGRAISRHVANRGVVLAATHQPLPVGAAREVRLGTAMAA